MTAQLLGLAELHRALADLPEKLEQRVLRGAVKAGAEVIAEAAREKCVSTRVRETITASSRVKGRVVTGLVQTKGDNAYLAPWLEFGTSAHTIQPARSRTGSPKRSLVIDGSFVGKKVNHPGALAHAFLRPALDQRQRDAVTVIGEMIAARLTKLDTLPLAAEIDE